MKRLKEKIRRKIKYYRVAYQQTASDDRVSLALWGGVMLIYLLWNVSAFG